MKLPYPVYTPEIYKDTQKVFGGTIYRTSAQEGEICQSQNLSNDEYPLLAPRSYLYWTHGKEYDPDLHDGIVEDMISDGEYVWAFVRYPNEEDEPIRILFSPKGVDMVAVEKSDGTLEDYIAAASDKRSVTVMGDKRIVFPDKIVITVTDDRQGHYSAAADSISSNYSGNATFEDGTIGGVTAARNTIRFDVSADDNTIKIGDGVTISGSRTPSNNKVAIVREIESDASSIYFRFDENSFVNTEGEAEQITISTEIPDMDFVFSDSNRIWGCKDKTIYASKLGDYRNFNVFDGLDSDSYALNVASVSPFTAAVSYGSYPTFFTEEAIYKIYGDSPTNYSLTTYAGQYGVLHGCAKSVAAVNNVLFYRSKIGIMSYSGSVPSLISENISELFKSVFDNDFTVTGRAAAFDLKYYLPSSFLDNNYQFPIFGKRNVILVYDTVRGTFQFDYINEDLPLMGNTRTNYVEYGDFCSVENILIGSINYMDMLMLHKTGCHNILQAIKKNGQTVQYAGELDTCHSYAVFDNIFDNSPDRKGLSKLLIRLYVPRGSMVKFFLGDGDTWELTKVAEYTENTGDYGLEIPIVPRRVDRLKMKIEADGYFRIYSITRCRYFGSERKR